MTFVDGEGRDPARVDQVTKGTRPGHQTLRTEEDDEVFAVLGRLPHGRVPLGAVEEARRDAALLQGVRLVLHQRNQRRYHDLTMRT